MKNIILLAGIVLSCLIANTGFTQSNNSSIFVNGLCGMCKERIEKAALQVKGVSDADWDIESRMLTVTTESKKV